MDHNMRVLSRVCVQLFETPRTVACQALLSPGFSRQKYWTGLPFPSPGDLPNPGIEPRSPALAGRFFTPSTTWEATGYRVAFDLISCSFLFFFLVFCVIA